MRLSLAEPGPGGAPVGVPVRAPVLRAGDRFHDVESVRAAVIARAAVPRASGVFHFDSDVVLVDFGASGRARVRRKPARVRLIRQVKPSRQCTAVLRTTIRAKRHADPLSCAFTSPMRAVSAHDNELDADGGTKCHFVRDDGDRERGSFTSVSRAGTGFVLLLCGGDLIKPTWRAPLRASVSYLLAVGSESTTHMRGLSQRHGGTGTDDDRMEPAGSLIR